MYTQCPQCLTYFQVTPEHLKVAQGNVRCGQCQNVFSALGNLTELPPEAVPQRSTATARQPQVNRPRTTQSIAKNFTRDLTRRPAAANVGQAGVPRPPTGAGGPGAPAKKGLSAAIDAMNKLNRASTGLQTLAEGRRAFIDKLQETTQARPRNISPQAAAQSMPQFRESPLTPPPKRQLKKAIPAPVKKKVVKKKRRNPIQTPMPRPSTGKDIAIAGSGADIDLQKALLAIDELDISGGNTRRRNNPLSDDFFGTKSNTGNFDAPGENGFSNPTRSDVKIKPLGRPNTNSGSTNTRALVPSPSGAAAATNNLSMQLIPKPLLADFQQAQSARLANLAGHKGFNLNIWIVGCVVLMVIFLGQTIYFKHDDLAKNHTIRPWIETFCRQANCEVSLPFEKGKLELLGQDIRSHPKISKALLVSVTIINNASYNQAYPGLQITFTDMNDQKVAMRRFKPDEYLARTTNIESGMPSNTPVQIELQLLDPGSKAVNFEFSFFNAG